LFLLIGFGEIVELNIENVFKIMNDNGKNKIYSIPSLTFQCTIAKICPAINHRKLKSTWSIESNDMFIKYSLYPKKLIGTVSYKIIQILNKTYII